MIKYFMCSYIKQFSTFFTRCEKLKIILLLARLCSSLQTWMGSEATSVSTARMIFGSPPHRKSMSIVICPFLKLWIRMPEHKNICHSEILWGHITVNSTPFCLSNLLFSVEQSQERVCWTSVRISLAVDIHRVVVPQNPWWPWLLPVIRCNCKSWQFLTAKWPIKTANWSDLPIS